MSDREDLRRKVSVRDKKRGKFNLWLSSAGNGTFAVSYQFDHVVREHLNIERSEGRAASRTYGHCIQAINQSECWKKFNSLSCRSILKSVIFHICGAVVEGD
jgi:hypothetical protein